MQPKLIVGADLSSKHLAFTAKHPLTPTAMVIKYDVRTNPKGLYTPDAAGEALDATLAFIHEAVQMAGSTVAKVAYVEAPVMVRNAQALIKQAFVNGVVQAALVKAGFEVELVPIDSWKMVIVGKGGADKQVVSESLKNLWPKVHAACGGDQDLIDSAAVCLYGVERERERLRTS